MHDRLNPISFQLQGELSTVLHKPLVLHCGLIGEGGGYCSACCMSAWSSAELAATHHHHISMNIAVATSAPDLQFLNYDIEAARLPTTTSSFGLTELDDVLEEACAQRICLVFLRAPQCPCAATTSDAVTPQLVKRPSSLALTIREQRCCAEQVRGTQEGWLGTQIGG
jgi:hypothetical protein